jgi:allophanate hydrolase subunit 2
MDHETTAGFLRQDWQVSPQSDRAGYRLKGEPLHPAQSEIVSEPLNVGSIQILKDGQPALILADGPTIGGYPKVANVAMADLDRIAHIGPGGTIGFLAVDLDAATALYTAYARRWKRLKTYLEEV